MKAIDRLKKSIRGVDKNKPVTQLQLSEIIQRLWSDQGKIIQIIYNQIINNTTNIYQSINQIVALNLTKQITGITLISANWSLVSGLYEYNLADSNITVNSIVEVIPSNSSISIIKAAEILPETDSNTGSVKLYATNAPTGDISVTINITEKQVS